MSNQRRSSSRTRSTIAFVLAQVVVATALMPSPARADDEVVEPEVELAPVMPPPTVDPNRHWQAHWERFSAVGGVLIATAEGAAFAVYLSEPVTQPLWVGTLPGDEDFRSALRLESYDDRDTAVLVSDVMLYSLLVYPVVVDAFVLAGLVHRDEDAALQMALIDAEVLAIAHMATWLTSRLTGRVRPDTLDCAVAGTCSDTGSGPVSSFVGGHSLMAYAAAGLVCVHHIENPWLSGSVGGAAAMCAAGLSIASGMSVLRLNADRHWASDVWLGSLMGAAFGFGLPYVLSYGRARLPREVSTLSIRPGSDGGPLGVTVAGVF